MRCLVQRVTEASVRVDAALIGSIGRGLLILLGVSEEDDEATAEKMVRKLLSARIFEDGEGKTNLSLSDISGELLQIFVITHGKLELRAVRGLQIENGEIRIALLELLELSLDTDHIRSL